MTTSAADVPTKTRLVESLRFDEGLSCLTGKRFGWRIFLQSSYIAGCRACLSQNSTGRRVVWVWAAPSGHIRPYPAVSGRVLSDLALPGPTRVRPCTALSGPTRLSPALSGRPRPALLGPIRPYPTVGMASDIPNKFRYGL
jgi:hypothetical protein